MLQHIALCHEVIIDPSTENFSALSPDDLALVEGAKNLGVEFLGSEPSDKEVVSIKFPGITTPKKWTILHTLKFSSDRKRMSVIVKSTDEEKIELLCKGADSTIESLLKDPREYEGSTA